MFRQRNPSKKF